MIYSKPFILYSTILLIAISFSNCSSKQDMGSEEDARALVTVNGKTLHKGELDALLSQEMSPADSTLAAEAYIKMWIKNELMYEKAKENLNGNTNIDELVESYRQSLTIFTYQEQLLKQRLSKEISDKEIQNYYEANPDKFKLQTNIIKGLFLKVPLTASRLEDLRKWYKSTSGQSVENIEKYSLENAVIYDYFYNRWVDFEEVMSNIPMSIDNPPQFLKTNKSLEFRDSSYVYLLNIKEYLLENNKAPFDFVRTRILDILISQKREDFMKKFENDLYEDALSRNQIKFYNK